VGHKSLKPFAQWQRLCVLFLTGIYIPMYDKNCATKEVEKGGRGCEEFVTTVLAGVAHPCEG
jgi:hypothetical protein